MQMIRPSDTVPKGNPVEVQIEQAEMREMPVYFILEGQASVYKQRFEKPKEITFASDDLIKEASPPIKLIEV